MLYSKNTFVVSRALVLLESARSNPKKYASTKETFMCRVVTILEMTILDFDVFDFYSKHLSTNGFLFINLYDEVDEKWAHHVIDDAIDTINFID